MRNIPPDPDESVSEHVEHFFCVNHPDHYLSHQVCNSETFKLIETLSDFSITGLQGSTNRNYTYLLMQICRYTKVCLDF